MEITLRSQMIAGATAIVGAGAIALTPVAPAVSIPSISAAKAEVALSAIANPFVVGWQTVVLGLDYLFQAGAPVSADWQVTNVGIPIGPVTNAGLQLGQIPVGGGLYRYGPAISNVGLIPNFLAQPFPVLTQLVANQLGYLNTALQAGGTVVTNVADILWTPVGLTLGIISDLLTGNVANIPVRINAAITQVIADVTGSVTAVVNAATAIGTGIINNAVAVVSALAGSAGSLIPAVLGQFQQVSNSVQNVIAAVASNLATFNLEGAWNAAVNGLLGPTGVPGTLLNLTLGAGTQLTPDSFVPVPTPGTLVPSDRVILQTFGQELSGILAGQTPAASAATPAAARAAAAVTAAPAAEAQAGDNSPAADAPAASAPAAASDNAVADAPAPAKGKAAAGKAGRR